MLTLDRNYTDASFSSSVMIWLIRWFQIAAIFFQQAVMDGPNSIKSTLPPIQAEQNIYYIKRIHRTIGRSVHT